MATFKKWMAGHRLPLIAGLVALACAAAALGLYAQAPRQRVLRAMQNTLAAAEARRDADMQRLGFPLETVEEGPVEQALYLGAPPGPLVPDTGVSAEAGAELVLRSNLPEGLLYAAGSLQAGRVPVYRATLLGRDDLLALRVPSLFMGSYGLNPITLGTDWNASALAELTGATLDEGLGFSPVALARQPLRPKDGTRARLLALGEDLLAGMNAQRLGDETLEGQDCVLYGIEVEGEAVAGFLGQAAATLRADPAANLGRAAAQLGEGALPPEALALLDAPWQMADTLERAEAGTLEGCVWLGGGRLRRMELQCVVDGEALSLEMTFGTGGDPLDGLALYFEAGDARGELSFAGGAATQAGALSRRLEASWERGGEMITLEGALRVEPDLPQGGSLSLEGTLEAGGSRAGLRMAGRFGADPTAGTFAAELDHCLLSLPGGEQTFRLEYSLGPLASARAFGEAEAVTLLDLSRDEAEKWLENFSH